MAKTAAQVLVEQEKRIKHLEYENGAIFERVSDLEEDNCDLQIRVTKLETALEDQEKDIVLLFAHIRRIMEGK